MTKLLAPVLSGLLAVLVFGSSVPVLASAESEIGRKTEIQIFLNYRGSNDYDKKLVSTWENPATAEYLYTGNEEEPLNGACFKGDPDDAISLFTHMVELFNDETGRSLETWGESYYDETIRAHALVIYERDENGITSTWFQRMRECIRWSTPAERRN